METIMAEEEVMELQELDRSPLRPQPRYLIIAEIQHGRVERQARRDDRQIHLGAAHYVRGADARLVAV